MKWDDGLNIFIIMWYHTYYNNQKIKEREWERRRSESKYSHSFSIYCIIYSK